jgi:DNA-binding transcriptional LysR family regulator
MLNLRQLEIFRAVMSHQSTVGAARDLLVSQPAVSNAIRHLEDQLGFALFDRTGNRLVPREEARVLYRESEAIFLLSRALNQTVGDLKDNRRGRVRVVATPQLGHTVLPAAVEEFLRKRPKVKVVIDIAQSYNVVESVEVAAADFGLAIALEKELSQTFEMVPLATLPLVCVVPARHPLAKAKVIRPKDLRHQALIGLEMGSRLGPLIRDAFRAEAVAYASTVEVRFSETAFRLVEAGAGVTVVDGFTARQAAIHGAKCVVVPFKPTSAVSGWALHPKSRPLSRVAAALLKTIQSHAAAFKGA